MKDLAYVSPGKEVREVEKPRIINDSEAIIRLTKTTICGGEIPACKEGTILGHFINGT